MHWDRLKCLRSRDKSDVLSSKIRIRLKREKRGKRVRHVYLPFGSSRLDTRRACEFATPTGGATGDRVRDHHDWSGVRAESQNEVAREPARGEINGGKRLVKAQRAAGRGIDIREHCCDRITPRVTPENLGLSIEYRA